jgi:CTP synthase
MSPSQHGEVFVTEDGMECDMDLGPYERFTGISSTKDSNITAGRIYQMLLENERKGSYLGATVQTIPHVTSLIQEFILKNKEACDIIICEIGGTVGDIEALPFFEAARQVKRAFKKDVAFVHLTYVPYLEFSGEIKTKPTQHSVKELMSIGISPTVLICRSSVPIGEESKKKIALFCNVDEACVIEGLDTPNIHSTPQVYAEQKLHLALSAEVGLPAIEPNLKDFAKIIEQENNASKKVNILIAGKYSANESYKSLFEAIRHACAAQRAKPEIKFINAKNYDDSCFSANLAEEIDAIIIPGGFGMEGVAGKIKVIEWAIKANIPTLGICFGMQLMMIEFARNELCIKNASSEEFEAGDATNIIGLITSFEKDGKLEARSKTSNLGGTMRLGAYPCKLLEGSLAKKIYGTDEISERHRHRYEANIKYKQAFEDKGMLISGLSLDGALPEICEVKGLRFFLGTQFHPELKSQILKPHPIFNSLIKEALQSKKSNA